ncbi:MAG: LysM peptidoglycan-binding domain-containing protein [Bacteroidales bacterium]|nr:LysM peptidoglycan-binding domain-containing protein [Bacteroidales bacterium]
MKRSVKAGIAASVMAFALYAAEPAVINAQEYENTPVTISKDKVRVDGIVCYSHIVLEKQTLYSISKTYCVTIEDIYRFNPQVKERGLKKNDILVIPASIEISVPKEETGARKLVQPASKAERIHVVKWFEDIDMIAKKYGVSAETIMEANNLKDRKLSKRLKLIIPYEDIEVSEPEEDTVTETADSTATADSSAINDHALFPDWLKQNKEVKMSVILPLKATGNSSNRNNMDFYSGVLLAAHDLGKEGINMEISVFDMADGNIPITDSRIESSDVVIGPIAPGDLAAVLELSDGKSHIVSPLDPRAEQLARTHGNFIHAPTPHAVQYDDIAAWIKEDSKVEDRILVITEKGARETENISMMKSAIDSAGISYSPFSYSILEGRNITDPLTGLMTENGANRVFIASESEAFVNDVVRNLNVMIHKKYNVVLYAPSKIRSFETIEVENFHNTSMHVSLGYYIDYDDPRVMDFLLKYRALFNTEPTQFAFQGYDLARYFANLCGRDGKKWHSRLDQTDMSMLQSTFRFRPSEEGGYVNQGVRRIIYSDDWSVLKVK